MIERFTANITIIDRESGRQGIIDKYQPVIMIQQEDMVVEMCSGYGLWIGWRVLKLYLVLLGRFAE